jgi:hypothetical protein
MQFLKIETIGHGYVGMAHMWQPSAGYSIE